MSYANTFRTLSKITLLLVVHPTVISCFQKQVNCNTRVEIFDEMDVQHQMNHMHDSAMNQEHMAALNLLPHNQATYKAVKSGSWFDPSTWGGKVPDDGAKVLIPNKISVTYDDQSDSRLDIIRVDGKLEFAHNRDTKMIVDTVLVSSSGELQIGTERQPIQDNVKAEILIADNGPINLKWDPEQLSRGLVANGQVTIHGEEKTTFLKLKNDAMAGDRELVLQNVPTNWEVGDSLVLTGTEYLGTKNRQWLTQDEELTIKAINGNRIILEETLKYDHTSPRGDLKAYVSNFTRNVVISSENPDVPTQERGHVMFMHSDDVDVRYAEFHELGRTDKSKSLDDKTNHVGRYAVHFHRSGVDDSNGKPAFIQGSSVWGSPGLGYVHHDSHVVMDNNAAYDVFGAAYISETGNEIGTWTNNIAIKSEGTGTLPKNNVKGGHDPGKSGVGFWFQGRVVGNEGNIAANTREAGFVYSLRGSDQKDVLVKNLDFPNAFPGETKVSPNNPEIHNFRDNEVIGSDKGIYIFKTNPKQGHDVRSVFEGFTAWEIGKLGIWTEYTGKYTLKDIDLLASENASNKSTGVRFGNNNVDMVLNRSNIEGFNTGVDQLKFFTGDKLTKSSDWRFAYIDVNFKDIGGQKFTNFNSKFDIVKSGKDLNSDRLTLNVDAKADLLVSDKEDLGVTISGTKVDSLGSVGFLNNLDGNGNSTNRNWDWDAIKQIIADQGGYYTHDNGTRYLIIEELIGDRATGETARVPIEVRLNVPDRLLPAGAKNLGKYEGSQLKPNPEPEPVPEPEPAPEQTPGSPLRVEIEGFELDGFKVHRKSLASDGRWISLYRTGNTEGIARSNFSGESGTYNVVVGYADENDGEAILSLKIGNQEKQWLLNQDLGSGGATRKTMTERVVAQEWSINKGDEVEIQGMADQEEWARIDYIDFVPVSQSGGSTSSKDETANDNDITSPPVVVENPSIKEDTAVEGSPIVEEPEVMAESNMGAPEPSSEIVSNEFISIEAIKSYGAGTQDKQSTVEISDDRRAIAIQGNGWKALPINYDITPDTMLRVEFRSNEEGDIHAIGFDNNLSVKRREDRKRLFQFSGDESWGKLQFDDYVTGSGWKTYEIPVGNFYTGDATYLTFVNDHDASAPTASSEFRNIEIFELNGGISTQSNDLSDSLIRFDESGSSLVSDVTTS